MKKAFTLIEVLFSVVLISMIGYALLVSASNNTKLIAYNENKQEFIQGVSIFAINMNDSLHNKTKSFAEILDDKYKLDDETRKMLKQKEYLLRYKQFDTVVLEDSSVSDMSFSFDIYKESISGKYSAYLYSIKSLN